MSMQQFPGGSLDGAGPDTDGSRSQFGAVCYRKRDRKCEVLLITSRGTGRWIVPKGWPVPGQSPAQSAATEAFEEAGVEGTASPVCLGIYSYEKVCATGAVPCVVALYALSVARLLRKYPESGQRKRKWVSLKRAADMVDEPELKAILRRFDPTLVEK